MLFLKIIWGECCDTPRHFVYLLEELFMDFLKKIKPAYLIAIVAVVVVVGDGLLFA